MKNKQSMNILMKRDMDIWCFFLRQLGDSFVDVMRRLKDDIAARKLAISRAVRVARPSYTGISKFSRLRRANFLNRCPTCARPFLRVRLFSNNELVDEFFSADEYCFRPWCELPENGTMLRRVLDFINYGLGPKMLVKYDSADLYWMRYYINNN